MLEDARNYLADQKNRNTTVQLNITASSQALKEGTVILNDIRIGFTENDSDIPESFCSPTIQEENILLGNAVSEICRFLAATAVCDKKIYSFLVSSTRR